MTGQNIIDKFTNLVSDSLDADFALQLVNDAKNAIETELELEITKKLNSSSSTTAGQTSTTAITLPSDFFTPLTIYIGTTPYTPIPFEHQQFFKDEAQRYWIDHANNHYRLTGTQGSAQTIYFFYQYATTDLTTTTSPVWPTRFHSLIPLEMARQHWQIDQGERSRSWDDKFQADYLRAKNLMIQWDQKLKLAAIDSSAYLDNSPFQSENRPSL
jgi:hypothetical protein